MELVLKTSEQQCFVGSNPTASASFCQIADDLASENEFQIVFFAGEEKE